MDRAQPMAHSPSEPTLSRGRPARFLAAGWIVPLAMALAGAGLVGRMLFQPSVPRESTRTVGVVVSVAPIGWLVEQIGGELVGVEVLIPPGADPHTYSPTPREALTLGRARVIVCTGLPLERQLLSRLSGEPLSAMIVDLAQVCAPAEGAADHGGPGALPQPRRTPATNGPGERPKGNRASRAEWHAGAGQEHHHAPGADHEFADPHVWLSPPLLREHARQIARALARVDPAHAAQYESRLRQLDARLEALDRRITAQLEPHRGKTFYVFHPAFGHFGEAYGLHQQAIQWRGWAASPRHLHDVIAQARADGVQIILVQPQYDPRQARVVAEAIGASLVVADPLAPNVREKLAGQIAAGWEHPGAGAGAAGATGESPPGPGVPQATVADKAAPWVRKQAKAREP